MKVQDYLKQERRLSTRIISDLKQTPNGILMDGALVRTIDRLRAGALLELTLMEEETALCQPSSIEVPILYDDEDLMVFDKPSGMPCHPSKQHQQNTLGNVFAAYCLKNGLSLPFRPINRLDRDTSGIVVAAKNAYAASILSGQAPSRQKRAGAYAGNEIQKEYTALVHGVLEQDEGTIDAPISRAEGSKMERTVCPDGQRAVTHYRVLERFSDAAYVLFWLETGRTHQIRVHMAHLGHPLIGDDLYGGDRTLVGRQMLHCHSAVFSQPVSGALIRLESALPPDMAALLDFFRTGGTRRSRWEKE